MIGVNRVAITTEKLSRKGRNELTTNLISCNVMYSINKTIQNTCFLCFPYLIRSQSSNTKRHIQSHLIASKTKNATLM